MKHVILLVAFTFTLSASEQETPSFQCDGKDAATYGGVTCTAFNVGELRPTWATFAAPLSEGQKPSYVTHGWAVDIQLVSRWSLIVMTVTNGKQTASAKAWGRKGSPT